MSSSAQVLKTEGPKLVPFFKSLAVYFVLFIPFDSPSLWALFVKILPMLSLIFFVALHGVGLKDEYTFSRRVMFGLIFSTFGDGFLVWDQFFIYGMVCFAIGHVFYIRAFGLRDFNKKWAIFIYVLTAYVVSKLIPGTTGVFTVGVPIYSIFLSTMILAAICRVHKSEDNSWPWTEICSCIGGISFAVSDACIGFDRFVAPIPNAQLIIMVSYYFSQFGIALSVVDSSSTYKLAQEKLLEQFKKERNAKLRDGAKMRRTAVKTN